VQWGEGYKDETRFGILLGHMLELEPYLEKRNAKSILISPIASKVSSPNVYTIS